MKNNFNLRERRIKKPRAIEDLGCFNTSFLSKKTRRTSIDVFQKQKNKKEASSKIKKCFKIFQAFKSSILYHDYPLFVKVEKNLKSNCYSHHTKLAQDIRNIFTHYFEVYSFDPKNYIKSLSACNSFEAIYKDCDSKLFIKESKNLIEIKKKVNRMQKELKETIVNNNKGNSNGNHHQYHRTDSYDNAIPDYSNEYKIANRKYKLSLANNIRQLSLEQQKGIAALLSKAAVDSNANTIEIDVNRIPSYQLKELDKYVQKCLYSNLSISSENENNLQKLDSTQSQDIHDENNLFDNKQSIFSNSESLSSDDSDSDSDDESNC